MAQGPPPILVAAFLLAPENRAVQAITDLPDGSFQLEPKPQAIRTTRILPLVFLVADVGTSVVVALLALLMRKPGLLIATAALLLFAAVMQLLTRHFFKPPLLKADSATITYLDDSRAVVVPRAELTMIFQGQVVQKARYTAWVQSYLFGVGRGRVMFSVPAWWYRSEDVAAFAHRLGVPVRGDFTQRVSGAELMGGMR